MTTATNIFTETRYPWGQLITCHAGLLTLDDAYLNFEPTNNGQKELKDAIISHITEGYGDFSIMSPIPMSESLLDDIHNAQQERKRLQIKPNRPGDFTMYLACMLKVLVDDNVPVQDAWDTVCKSISYREPTIDLVNMANTAALNEQKNSVCWITLD